MNGASLGLGRKLTLLPGVTGGENPYFRKKVLTKRLVFRVNRKIGVEPDRLPNWFHAQTIGLFLTLGQTDAIAQIERKCSFKSKE